MNINSYNKLDDEKILKVRELEKKVKHFDKTYRSVYLSNQFNVNRDMPSFFLAMKDDTLIGFLSVYADELPYGEITVFVDPDYRKQGISKELILTALLAIEKYGITEIVYYTEKNFMENNPYSKTWEYIIDDSELLLSLDTIKVKYENDLVNVRRTIIDDVDSIAKISAIAFEEDIEIAKNYVISGLEDFGTEVWTILFEDKIVGTLSIDTKTECDFYFAVSIDPKYQGKGIGKVALNKIIRNRKSNKVQQLQCNIQNIKAIRMYNSNGFEEISEIRYIKKL